MFFPEPSREELLRRETELLANSAAPSTMRARRYQANCYERFCNNHKLPYLPCDPPRIATYIAYLSFFMIYSSMLNYLSGLSYYLKSRGKQGVDFTNFCIRSALSGARRLCGKGRGKSVGIFRNDLLSIYNRLNFSKCNHLVFWSALTLAFRCLLRASNYCYSRHTVLVCDLKFTAQGMIVCIRSSKTNQFHEYVSEIPVFANKNSVICPINWLFKMLAMRKPSRGEALFKILKGKKWRPMSATWFNKMLRKYCEIPKVTSHSLRRGGASFILKSLRLSSVDYGSQAVCMNIFR